MLSNSLACDTKMRITEIVDKHFRVELFKQDNAKAFSDLILRIGGEVLLLALVLYFLENRSVLFIIPFYVCSIWHSFWGYAGIGHEFYHARVFSSPNINKLLFRISSYLTWNNPVFFEKSHRYHHAHTFADDDSEGYSLQKWDWFSILLYLTIDLPQMYRRIFYVLINALGITISGGSYVRMDGRSQMEAISMIIFNVAIQFGFSIAFHSLAINIVWFLLPFTGQFYNRLLAQSQHIGLSTLNNDGPLKHSRTLLLPRVIEFLYAGMNFHAEHHLAPAVPYYNLPKLNAVLFDKGLIIKIDIQSFFCQDFWWAIQDARSFVISVEKHKYEKGSSSE